MSNFLKRLLGKKEEKKMPTGPTNQVLLRILTVGDITEAVEAWPEERGDVYVNFERRDDGLLLVKGIGVEGVDIVCKLAEKEAELVHQIDLDDKIKRGKLIPGTLVAFQKPVDMLEEKKSLEREVVEELQDTQYAFDRDRLTDDGGVAFQKPDEEVK